MPMDIVRRKEWNTLPAGEETGTCTIFLYIGMNICQWKERDMFT